METTVSDGCRKCLTNLASIYKAAIEPDRPLDREKVRDLLERLNLWSGNIGALHSPSSSLSLETRLYEATDVLSYILDLLRELIDATNDLLDIASGTREGSVASAGTGEGEKAQDEVTELLDEVSAAVTALFHVSTLIRQVAPVDLFQKALSRDRYRFNSQYDVAYVGEKYPKLAADSVAWLRRRLGEAITRRRHYLSYIYDHRAKLEGFPTRQDTLVEPVPYVTDAKAPAEEAMTKGPSLDDTSRPDTFFTEVTAKVQAGVLSTELLVARDGADFEEDAKSYTTITRSVDGDYESSAALKIPKLEELQKNFMSEIECPFCFRLKRFKNERQYRRHVFSDLRAYVCTFPDCDVAYFGDIDNWFQHEMQDHRVQFDCQICSDKTFRIKDNYLAHVCKDHPDLLKGGEEKLVLAIAKRPLAQIPTEDCPCCSEWTDRVRASMVEPELSEGSQDVICATPKVFRRHLATHLEQLALFAVPLPANVEEDAESNAALVTYGPSDRLDAFFVTEGFQNESYTEAQIDEVAMLLSRIKPHWSANPRTYIILRISGHLQLFDEFIKADLSDYYIPYKESHLRRIGFAGDFMSVIDAQKLVVTMSTPGIVLEGRHCYFNDLKANTQLVPERRLNYGGSAVVEVVRHLSTDTTYRRFKYCNVLRHPHLVNYVGSFTNLERIGCILSPAATETLNEYLAHADRLKLRTFIGCLAKAVEYLHSQKVVHNDIKPSNILLHEDNVLLAGFSLSLDLRDSENGIVRGKPLAFTRRYCAPEILNYEPRGTSVDIWSLGLVFAEIFIALKGTLIAKRRESVHSDAAAVLIEYLKELEQEAMQADNVVLDWIRSMLSIQQDLRPTATTLVTRIQAAQEPSVGTPFFARCCSIDNNSYELDAQPAENPENELMAFFQDRKSEPYTDSEIRQIATSLTQIMPPWGENPRAYVILRTIGRLDLFPDFIAAGYSDYWLPFSDRGLPKMFKQTAKIAFLDAQKLIMSQSIELSKDEHAHFDHEENRVPFDFVESLGSGSFGHVSRAISRFDRKEYALRRWPRDKRKKETEMVEMLRTINEINILRRLNHQHIIKFAGSYTDYKFICCVVEPVADMNLSEYLDRIQVNDYQTLRSFFGCLIIAVKHLHDSKIIHGDINPRALLVCRNTVYLSAFGLSWDFSNTTGNTTLGRQPVTRRTCAPEVAASEGQKRDTKSDIWSLGVVFLDMVVALKGRRLDDTDAYLLQHGSNDTQIHANIAALPGYIKTLDKLGETIDSCPLDWIERMLVEDPDSRLDALRVAKFIDIIVPSDMPNPFFGHCC